MGKVQRVRALKVPVDIRTWSLQESDETHVPVPFPDEASREGFLTAFPGRLDIRSSARMHTADVLVEEWGTEPPENTGSAWEVREEAEFESATGEVAIWSDGRGDSFLLSGPGRWSVRVYCAGREEAARQSRLVGAVHGVESYLIQFWRGN
ncbi:hypothetical protein [Streptomyces sp. CA-132043]|uniref:hypothetical protein n=1 Tax=Streptomyces sp. CA-132043 TaxID=3240048 RepID=UPI003D8AE301